ncbi:MAG: sulfotransferase family 2 domain-containing protein, partial [Syntrophobacteraceae bacterium]
KFGEPCLVFLHIQKTAGTSMQNHLRDCFGQKEFYSEHSDSLYIHSPAELSTYDVFAGHFNYDSLRFIPRRTLSIFTFVREPRQRLISLYHFLRAHESGHPNFVSEGTMELANRLLIEEFFENPEIRKDYGFWNNMCWAVMGQLQWREWMSLLTTEKDETAVADILDSAIRPAIIERLKEFMFIGLQEDFDRSVQALFRIIEKQPPAKVRADHSLEKLMLTEPDFKRKMEKQPVTLRVNTALDGLIQLDNIVYEEAQKLYAERMAWLQL